MKLRLPLTFDDVTCHQIQKHGDRELSDYDLVKVYGGYKDAELRDIEYSLIEAGAKHLKDILQTKVNKHQPIIEIQGDKFGFIPSWGDLTGGEYIDLTTYAEEPIENVCKIMSILYRPIERQLGDTYEIEKYKGTNEQLFQNVSASLYFGAMLFFWNIKRNSLMTSLQYLEKELQTGLQKNGGGITRCTSWLKKTFFKFKRLLLYPLRKY